MTNSQTHTTDDDDEYEYITEWSLEFFAKKKTGKLLSQRPFKLKEVSF